MFFSVKRFFLFKKLFSIKLARIIRDFVQGGFWWTFTNFPNKQEMKMCGEKLLFYIKIKCVGKRVGNYHRGTLPSLK